MVKNTGLFILLFSIIIIASCTKPDIQWGQGILSVNSNTQLVMVDTFKPKILTVYVDSFATSGKGIGLVGNYTDPVFGKVAAQSYFELKAPTVSTASGSSHTNPYWNAQYDSICLVVKLKKGNYYGDSTYPLHINVNRLTQLIEPPYNCTSLYNLDTFAVNPTSIGNISTIIKPNFTDSILIRLSDAFGKELFSKLSNPLDTAWKTQDNFLSYLPGLRLSGTSDNVMVMGYNDSVVMRLYIKRAGSVIPIHDETVDFAFSNSPHQFNHIKIDRTGSPINGINTINREIPSESTNNCAYLQAITGSIIKIMFPDLYTIQQLPNFAKIMSAKLIVRPIQNTYSLLTLPPKIRVSVTTTAANDIGSDLVSASGSSSVQYGDLYTDYLYGINTAYTYDLSNYIKSNLTTRDFYPGNHYGLLLSPPSGSFETTFNRAIFGDANQSLTTNRIELQIIYATVQ